jgi:inner membrane transporter RhtA
MRSARDIAVMTGSGLSSQLGAAVGALAFPVIGAVGVVAVRQWVAGAVLLAVGRPRLRSFDAAAWRTVAALATVFATMNVCLYAAIDRIGLGLAVTLEFLGPLGVAVCAARDRRARWAAAVAALGVLALTHPRPSSDYAGIGLALVAAASWAAYILLNRSIGARLPGSQGTAVAATASALAFIPIGVAVFAHHPPTPLALACAAAAGVLSSVIPCLADLFALRRVPPGVFGVFMSINPALAALVGLLILRQVLDLTQWLGIAAVVTANALALSAGKGQQEQHHQPERRHHPEDPAEQHPLPERLPAPVGVHRHHQPTHDRGADGGAQVRPTPAPDHQAEPGREPRQVRDEHEHPAHGEEAPEDRACALPLL